MSCADPVYYTARTGRANWLPLVLYHQGAPLVDLSGVTRVSLDFGGAVGEIDSDAQPANIRWNESVDHRGKLVNVLQLRLGLLGVPVGDYSDVAIVVFDPTYPQGLEIENPVAIKVVA